MNNYELFRQGVAILFLLDLIFYTPVFSVFFGRGYQSDSIVARRPVTLGIYGLWAVAIGCLFLDFYAVIAAGTLAIIFRYYFVKRRWKSLLRGAGAPGYLSYFAAFAIFLFELARILDASGKLTETLFLWLRIDFALILLCAGCYKSFSGYLKGDGMQVILSNPAWSYFYRFFKKIPVESSFFKIQNWMGPLGQIVAGFCLLVPATQVLGALLCSAIFVYTIMTFRLGRLTSLMAFLPILFLPELSTTLILTSRVSFESINTPTWVLNSFVAVIYSYLILLPIIKVMQYVNLFLNKEFPQPFQNWFVRFANWFPIVMLRVFATDGGNFFIRIYTADQEGKSKQALLTEEVTYSFAKSPFFWLKMRFLAVAESITLASIFTTLKYFKSQRELFESRLLRYAQTLKDQMGQDVDNFLFEYVSIKQEGSEGCRYEPVVLFHVDLQRNEIREEKLDLNFDYSEKTKYSPIREGKGYGSYVAK